MTHPKVAHITTFAALFDRLLLHQLDTIRQGGYAVTGVSSPGPEAAVLATIDVAYRPIPIPRTLAPHADLLALWRLYRLLRRERFAVVHTHNPKPGLLGQLAARLAGVPVVINTVHGFYFHEHMHPLWRRFYILLETLAARCSDVILSQNLEDLETAIREGICPAEKIKHLGNGIDLAAFNPARFTAEDIQQRRAALGLPTDAKVVGFVGRLAARRKGFLDFLRAGELVLARDPSVRFLIIGDTDHGKADAVDPAVIAASPISHACHYLGPRPNSELPGFYALMDLFVLPSLFEGVPRVIMEASAMGLPTVATNVKGNREAVVPGQTGWLVPYGDVTALADAITNALSDPIHAQQFGAAARQLALECFDERRAFAMIIGEYSRLLQAKGLPTPDIPIPQPIVA